ncbi:NCS1 family nucleobase:cation symporter-1 [Aquamicrobium lusatiense]|uniref:NCS1 family nucleobase:cation symporter-1 n=1 Tax=Aquamicrobium lusatiense TaxID=89772 RepID=UPI002457AEDC|nr:NCS1 family nucleobase:cation symporter-1 [Aquamicrobium lusatiense]MDH4989299.1 NCS1 family nucleobase:cation symporter-1 [Aquamicrobium lusatiense]
MHKHANESSRLFNVELSPETATGTWKTWNLFAWWMSGWHSLGGYTMAVGLFALGLSGYQMIAAFTAGIIILYFTNNMSGVAGQRVKVPFPVFARASFGVYGANIPAILRAIVAVAWYGIQTYLASAAMMLLVIKVFPSSATLTESSFAGLSALGWICFLVLSFAQLIVLSRGMEAVRRLSDFAGPAIWIAMIALAVWVLARAGWSVDFSYRTIEHDSGLFGMASAMFIVVAYLAGPTLNFADFTRNAPDEASVRRGNAWGLLLNATAFGAISIVIALASVKVYGEAIHDPIALMKDIDSIAILLVAIIAIGTATAGINIIMNFVAPVYDIINVWPRHFTFRKAGVVVAILSVIVTPWNLFSSPVIVNHFIGSVGALMGPLYGIVMADYYIIRRQKIDSDALFDDTPGGKYYYNGGYNTNAIIALVVSGVIAIGMSVIPAISAWTPFSWPVGVVLSALIYCQLSTAKRRALGTVATD